MSKKIIRNTIIQYYFKLKMEKNKVVTCIYLMEY